MPVSVAPSAGGLRLKEWDFGEIWNSLKANILSILENPLQKPARTIIQLDRDVHKLTTGDKCTNMPQPRRLRDHQLGEPVAKRCLTIHLLLEEVLEAHVNQKVLPSITEKPSGPQIVKAYVEAFDTYKRGMKIVQVIFRYLRGQAQRTKAGTQVHHDTWQLGMSVWRQELLHRIRQSLMTSILDAIEKDRVEGSSVAPPVPPDVMRRAVMSLIQVADPRSPHTQYTSYFEQPFLQATTRYCRLRVAELQATDNVDHYVAGAMKMVNEESRRVSECFDRVTGPHLHKHIFQIIVDEKLDLLFSKFDLWITSVLSEQGPYNLRESGIPYLMHRLYWLMQRSEQGLDQFKRRFEERVCQDGRARIGEALQTLQATGLAEGTQQYQTAQVEGVMQAIFSVYGSYHKVILGIFDGQSKLLNALNKGAKRFINDRNAAWDQSPRAAEFLARYLNAKLKSAEFAQSRLTQTQYRGGSFTPNGIGYGSTSTGNPAQDEVNMCCQVLSLLNDRDVFQTAYSNLLSLRLIYSRGSDGFCPENEQLVITRAKQDHGHDFTYKWQRMFHDAHENSAQLKETYLDFIRNGVRVQGAEDGSTQDEIIGGPHALARLQRAGLDSALCQDNFNPLVLMSGSWPITNVAAADVVLPPEPLLSLYDEFKAFYTKKAHQGRKLQFIPGLSWGVVRAFGKRLNSDVEISYELTVSHSQICILLLFNSSSVVSSGEIRTAALPACGNDEKGFEKQLNTLVQKKVIIPSSSKPGYFESNPNMSFSNKKVTLLLQRVEGKAGAGTGATGQDLVNATLSDRRFALQAAIMRVMKARKTLRHQDLISEVVTAVQSRFAANIQEIKANIDVLLEKEFLERSKEDGTVFNYVA